MYVRKYWNLYIMAIKMPHLVQRIDTRAKQNSVFDSPIG